MEFRISGHDNVFATHKATLEFTRDLELTRRGDCIIGVNADFIITKEILSAKKIKITISCDDISDYVTADVNPDFEGNHEIVIRKTNFLSKRTLGINASKAAFDIDRRIIERLKSKGSSAIVKIEVLD